MPRLDRISPVSPPDMKNVRKAENTLIVADHTEKPSADDSQDSNFRAVGIAIIMVAALKYTLLSLDIPATNI